MLYQFNGFELDSTNFCLKRDGENIDIEPQVFNLITYLIENRNKLVTRDEIFEQLWGDRNVLDATLSNHIKNARSILSDDGLLQKVIKTVHGRGYQFVAEIKTDIEPDITNSTQPSLKRKFLVPLLLLSVLLLFVFIFFNEFNSKTKIPTITKIDIAQKSIAILPFENRSDLKSDEFFTDGIHDDLLTQVSKIHELKTISRTSVMAYRNTKKNIRIIGKELGVTKILEGGVQRAGNKIRINVQLIDALTDEHLWAESYTRELTAENIFAIQTEISKAIAEKLEIALSPLNTKSPTRNLAALEAFFHAKANINKDSNEGYREAIKYLNEAIMLDENFAMAYAELAARYLDQIYLEGLNVDKQIAKAKPLIDKALELDQSMSHAYRVLAKLKMHSQDFDAGKLAYERAIELNSNNADALGAYGNYHFFVGNAPRAIAYLTKALELNPTNDRLAGILAKNLSRIGEFADARKIVNTIIKRRPDYAEAYNILSNIQLYAEHQYAKSMLTLKKSIDLQPDFPASPYFMGIYYLHIGDTERGIKWLRYLMKISPESKEARVTKADIHSLNQEFDQAYEIYLSEVTLNPQYLSHFIGAGIDADRYEEAIELSKKIAPELFSVQPVINNRNFFAAIDIGKWFKKHGQQEQADWLFQESLKVAQQATIGYYAGKQHNWVARIYLAMGKKKEALAAFTKLIDEGFYSNHYIIGSDYESIADEPEYKRLVKIIKTKLEIERKKLQEMEAKGELDIPNLP